MTALLRRWCCRLDVGLVGGGGVIAPAVRGGADMKGAVYGISTGDGGYLCELRVPGGDDAGDNGALPTGAATESEAGYTDRLACSVAEAEIADARNRAWWQAHRGTGRGLNR